MQTVFHDSTIFSQSGQIFKCATDKICLGKNVSIRCWNIQYILTTTILSMQAITMDWFPVTFSIWQNISKISHKRQWPKQREKKSARGHSFYILYVAKNMNVKHEWLESKVLLMGFDRIVQLWHFECGYNGRDTNCHNNICPLILSETIPVLH